MTRHTSSNPTAVWDDVNMIRFVNRTNADRNGIIANTSTKLA